MTKKITEDTLPTTTNKLRPLIDGDMLVYSCGFSADSQKRKEGKELGLQDEELEQWLQEEDYTAWAIGNVKTSINDIVGQFSDRYRLFLTGDGNFREQIATILPYKGNRDPTHKPKYYKEIKTYMMDRLLAEVIHGREADDAMGCAQWAHKDRSTVIASGDKDLDMVPGYHYNLRKGTFYDVGINDANLFFFRQMLTGDRTDNIPGINQIGDKRADKLIEDCGYDLDKVRAAVQEKYKAQYGEDWERAYQEVADLLWIERVENKKCPYLW